ncbi:MAG: hypothetical protein Q4C30_00850 [Bacteroidia bacterium]|nr:hypothetical protein [Bacteroidia bacterium]
MARISIERKHIMAAREAARRDSNARISGRSVFIKRYYGGYRIIGVIVSKRQRACRDIFADAQKLASYELKQWNKRRHWNREARRHKIKGAHRMAVSYFYKLLKENEIELGEALRLLREKRYDRRENMDAIILDFKEWDRRESKESPFFHIKFDKIEEYYETVVRLAG